MKSIKIKSIVISTFLLVFAGAGCNGDRQTVRGQASNLGADSPEAVVARIQAAAKTGNMRELAACMEPGALRQTAEDLYFANTMFIAFSEEEAEQMIGRFNEVAERRGLPVFELDEENEPEDPGALEAALDRMDHAGLVELVPELFDLMTSFGMIEEENGESGFLVPEGELTGLVIDGDRATGTIGGEELGFVRIDGQWFTTPPGY